MSATKLKTLARHPTSPPLLALALAVLANLQIWWEGEETQTLLTTLEEANRIRHLVGVMMLGNLYLNHWGRIQEGWRDRQFPIPPSPPLAPEVAALLVAVWKI